MVSTACCLVVARLLWLKRTMVLGSILILCSCKMEGYSGRVLGPGIRKKASK